MFLEIKDFLSPQAVARLTQLAAGVTFVDGRISNPANQTKNNLQASPTDPGYAESSAIVAEAFASNEEFRNFAYPRHVAPPLLARYEVGMKYGVHADTSHMRFGNELRRSDLSATIWLSPPDSYDGGELVVYLGTQPVALKPTPGSLVVYPSTQLHEVLPVRRGSKATREMRVRRDLWGRLGLPVRKGLKVQRARPALASVCIKKTPPEESPHITWCRPPV